jgi:hypothetical protein
VPVFVPAPSVVWNGVARAIPTTPATNRWSPCERKPISTALSRTPGPTIASLSLARTIPTTVPYDAAIPPPSEMSAPAPLVATAHGALEAAPKRANAHARHAVDSAGVAPVCPAIPMIGVFNNTSPKTEAIAACFGNDHRYWVRQMTIGTT